MEKDKTPDPRALAWGETLAATPYMRELVAETQMELAAGMPEEEIVRRLRSRAVNDPRIGLVGFFPFLNRKLLRLPARSLLLAIANHYAASIGKKQVRSLLEDLAARMGLDQWLAEYIIEWAKTGSPPPISSRLLGGVADIEIGPAGDKVQLVVATAGPASDPEQIAQDFLTRCAQVFPPETWQRKDFPVEHARYVRLFAEGRTDRQIAEAELEAEGWPWRAANDAEYKRVLHNRVDAIRQARKRWIDYVTQIITPVSRDSD